MRGHLIIGFLKIFLLHTYLIRIIYILFAATIISITYIPKKNLIVSKSLNAFCVKNSLFQKTIKVKIL